MLDLFRRRALLVLLAALMFAGNSAVGYMTTGGFIQNYTTDPTGPLHLPRTPVLLVVTTASAVWLAFTWLAGCWSDRIGRRNTYLTGFVVQLLGVLALFPLVDTGSLGNVLLALCLLSVGTGLTYGAQSAFYAELFPASIRFSGVSISYAIGAILGGAFAPMIAKSLIAATGSTVSVTLYLGGMTTIGFIATLLLRDRSNIPLGPDHEAAQAVSPVRLRNRQGQVRQA